MPAYIFVHKCPRFSRASSQEHSLGYVPSCNSVGLQRWRGYNGKQQANLPREITSQADLAIWAPCGYVWGVSSMNLFACCTPDSFVQDVYDSANLILERKCSACWDTLDLVDDMPVYTLDCGHSVHVQCLRKILQSRHCSNACPMYINYFHHLSGL